MKNSKGKVLLIGIDSLDPVIVHKLMEEGKLPNFRRLEFISLETTIPPETPVAWSAASTGCNPGRYGIFDFINRDTKTYMPRLNLAVEKPGILKTEYVSAMKGTPFWRILSRDGIPVTVIRWPVTFPAEKVSGRMLSGLGVVDLKGMLNSYSFYTDDAGKAEDNNKAIMVEASGGIAETYVSGPLTRKGGQLKDIRVPMKLDISESGVVIELSGSKHALKPGQWSSMMRIKFKIGMFLEVYGIAKFYLISAKPFKMYMTSVQTDPENQNVKITYPEDYGKELSEKLGLFYTLGMPEDTKAVTENVLGRQAFIEQIMQIEKERTAMFWYELGRFYEGVLAFGFDAGDRLKHIFWESGKAKEGWKVPEEIEKYYREKDGLIGEVLSKIDESTRLIIFSDHGFNDFDRQVNINRWLVRENYMKTGTEEGSLFSFVEWPETRAYSLGFTSLYINLKGREGQGIVSQEEKDALVDEIIRKLILLEDRGRKVFTSVYRGSEVYKGDFASSAPDIVLGFAPGYRMSEKSAAGGLDKEVVSDNKSEWRGDHLIDRSHVPGVLFTNFKINKQNPNIMDIAPTVLKFFNVKIADNTDGEALI